jgi:uncharacterized membrane protein
MQQNNIAFLNYQNNNQNSQYLQNNKQKNKAKNLDIFYMYEVLHMKNLSSTRTIYHNYIPSYAKDIKVKRYDYSIISIFIFIYFFILKFILKFPTLKLLYFVILILISIFLIVRGFNRYVIHNILNNTPVSKIHIATYGLDKVKGRFVPYRSQPLKTPISGQDCIYYSISTWYIHLRSYNPEYYFVDSFSAGIPALFTDGSGFLAVDLEKAPIVEVRTNIIEIIPNNSQNHKIKISNFNDAKRVSDEILQYIKYAANNNIQMNLSYIKNYEFIIGNDIIRNLKRYIPDVELKISIFHNKSGVKINSWDYDSQNHLYLVEQYIPINEDYTIFGGFADTGETINMKSVKVTVPDMSTGILEVRLSNIYRNEFIKKAIANITLGIIYLITGILVII